MAGLRYCLCVVARVAAQELAGEGPSALSLQRRRELFDLASAWAEEGAAGGALCYVQLACFVRSCSHFRSKRGSDGSGANQDDRAARWRVRWRRRACVPKTRRPRA